MSRARERLMITERMGKGQVDYGVYFGGKRIF